jgi:hypothetical protein
LRDIDILSEISKKSWCTVSFTITTLDKKLLLLLEPFASPTERRLEAMKKLTEADVTPDEVIRKQIIDESQIPWSLKILEVKIEKPASLKKW